MYQVKLKQMNDVTKICQYFTFNMGKSYTFVTVQVTDEGGRDQEFTTPYDDIRWVNFGDRGPSDVLGEFL